VEGVGDNQQKWKEILGPLTRRKIIPEKKKKEP